MLFYNHQHSTAAPSNHRAWTVCDIMMNIIGLPSSWRLLKLCLENDLNVTRFSISVRNYPIISMPCIKHLVATNNGTNPTRSIKSTTIGQRLFIRRFTEAGSYHLHMEPLSREHRDTQTDKDTEPIIYRSQQCDARSGLIRVNKIKGVVTVYNKTVKR